MKIVRIILSIVFSFVLMVGILTSTILYIGNNYINKEYLISKFEEIDLYTQVYEEVKEGFEDYIYQSGLDTGILDKICDREKVKQDILLIIDGIYNGNEVQIDTSSIRTNLDNAINEYVESQNRKLSKQEKENITKFEDLIVSSYENEFSIYKKAQELLSGNLTSGIQLVKNLKNISIISTIVIAVVLVVINIKNIYSGLSYIGVSLLSSGVILVLIEKLINAKVNIDDLVLFSKAISNTVIYIAREVLSQIGTCGVWYLCIGIVVIILSSMRNKI